MKTTDFLFSMNESRIAVSTLHSHPPGTNSDGYDSDAHFDFENFDFPTAHNELARSMVLTSYFDEVRLFIKNEPTKSERIEEGRERLIASVSVVDQVVERVFFQRFYDWLDTIPLAEQPTMIGANMAEDSDCQSVFRKMLKHFDDIDPKANRLFPDVSTFDWSQDAQDFLYTAKFIHALFKADVDRYWQQCITVLMAKLPAELAVKVVEHSPNYVDSYNWVDALKYYCYNKYVRILVTSSATCFYTDKPITLSGALDTGKGNSWRRASLALAVGALATFNVGDDGCELTKLSKKEAALGYNSLGIKVKFGAYGHFCGKDLQTGELLRPEKTFYRLISGKHDAHTIYQILWELRHWEHLSTEFSRYYQWISDRDPEYLKTLLSALRTFQTKCHMLL